ncbi:hypothetical protein [Mesorhizobium loti]|uniref:hypothetical protein n=1 Tax=Rhizobium loti TaxID=381 RepID=UPI0003F63968
MAAPVLREIVRQHAEMAAFLWTVYDHHLLHPEENPEMDEVRVARLIERLEAHLDGLRVAGDQGRKIAQQCYEEFSAAGELFVLRMLAAPNPIRVVDLDLVKVREYLAVTLAQDR